MKHLVTIPEALRQEHGLEIRHITVTGVGDPDAIRRAAYRHWVQCMDDKLAWFFNDMGLEMPEEWRTATVEEA